MLGAEVLDGEGEGVMETSKVIEKKRAGLVVWRGLDALEPLLVPVEDLHLDAANARVHPEKNITAIQRSLDRYGQHRPAVATKDGIVRIGNGMVDAARIMGWGWIAAIYVDESDIESTGRAIADNRTAELASWDNDSLLKSLRLFEEDENALLATGFGVDDLRELMGEPEPTGVDPGPGDPPAEAVTKKGDIWILGDHRLLCGDSTKLEDVLRVMDGAKARLCTTDPPYLIDYTGERPNNSGKDWSSRYHESDIKDADGFFRSAFTHVLEVLGPKGAIYCWYAHKRCRSSGSSRRRSSAGCTGTSGMRPA